MCGVGRVRFCNGGLWGFGDFGVMLDEGESGLLFDGSGLGSGELFESGGISVMALGE